MLWNKLTKLWLEITRPNRSSRSNQNNQIHKAYRQTDSKNETGVGRFRRALDTGGVVGKPQRRLRRFYLWPENPRANCPGVFV